MGPLGLNSTCAVCGKELGISRCHIRSSKAWICSRCEKQLYKNAGGIFAVDLMKITIEEVRNIINRSPEEVNEIYLKKQQEKSEKTNERKEIKAAEKAKRLEIERLAVQNRRSNSYQNQDPYQITCPQCHGANIQISIEETGVKTVKKNNGIIHGAARGTAILATGGLWALTPKRKGTEKSKILHEKVCVCQNCGYSWKIK
jgi:hypothetical protein